MHNILRRRKLLVSALIVLAGLGATMAVVPFGQSQASASNTICSAVNTSNADKVNIIYYGLSGGSTDSYIKSLQCYYSNNSSGHSSSPSIRRDYHDLQTVFSWFGVNADIINNMNSSNTVMGTVYRDGSVKIGSKTIATDAKVAARFSVPGAVAIPGSNNVFVRSVAASSAFDTRSALIYMKDGKMLFAVEVNCGNVVKATPVVPPPLPRPPVKPPVPPVTPPSSLACVSLSASQNSDNPHKFDFTVTGSAVNATINSYIFDFGDGTKLSSSQNMASHIYASSGTFNTRSWVNGTTGGKSQVTTSNNCSAIVTITTNVPQPALSCDSLLIAADSTNPNMFNFTISATAKNIDITAYKFDFGDGSSISNNPSSTVSHTYTAPGTYNVRAAVIATSKIGQTRTIISNACMGSVTIAQPTTPTPQPQSPPQVEGASTVAATTALPNTGSSTKGIVGLFLAVSVLGATSYHLFLRRWIGKS